MFWHFKIHLICLFINISGPVSPRVTKLSINVELIMGCSVRNFEMFIMKQILC